MWQKPIHYRILVDMDYSRGGRSDRSTPLINVLGGEIDRSTGSILPLKGRNRPRSTDHRCRRPPHPPASVGFPTP